jgi:hypothetical protein
MAVPVRLPTTRRPGRFPVVKPELRTVDGILFASKREAKRYAELRLLEKQGEIQDLRLQPTWAVEIAGKHFCDFSADFLYINKKGVYTIEEVKSSGSRKDTAYKLRRKAAELSHNITITEIVR